MGRTARLEDGFLSDDDPLAELANIVGYVPRPTTPQQPAATPRPVRREPEFDLEEELMREFERFDNPVVLPSYRHSQPVLPSGPVLEAGRDTEMEARQPVAQPVVRGRVEPDIDFRPGFQPAPLAAAQDMEEPVFALADDDLLAEFGIEEPSFADAPVPDLSDFGPDFDGQPDVTEELNLADELDMSLSAPVPELPQALKPASPVSAFAEWKTERLEGAPVAKAAVSARDPFDLNPDPQPLNPAPVAGAAQSGTTVLSKEPVAAQRTTDYGLDDLMAEVERYPVVAMSRTNPVLATPAHRPAGLSYTRPVAEKPPLFEPAIDTPALSDVADPVVAPSAAPAVAERIVPIDAHSVVNPFDESEFELDLDSIELEISDTVPDTYRTPVLQKAQDITLHFDPEQISDMAEIPESVADMHVPTLPVIEKEKPAAVHPDHYIENEVHDLFGVPPQPRPVAADADDDALHWGEHHYRPAIKDDEERINAQLAEFERELEEDFRRSLSDTPADYFAVQSNAAARMERKFKHVRQPQKKMSGRGWLLAASVGVIAVLGGGGVYAWIQSGSAARVATSSEPRVILADKEPMKVVPENRGGTTVPNQDKAVYDQVAGTAQADPKQEALVSTSEEPVDVVQKTLIPEGLPLDSPEESAGTPTEDTTDGRLLPGVKDEATADTDTGGSTQPAGVSPRKVKTMVVKPDGTLVARDDTTPAETSTPAPSVAEKPVDVAAATPDAASDMRATDVAPPADAASQQGGLADAANVQVDAVAPVRKVKTTVVAPVPTARPADQPVNVVGTVTDQGNLKADNTAKPVDVAAATQATETPGVPAATQTAAVPAGTYVMQVASLPSEDEAKRSYANLTRKFGSVISGKAVDIRRADVAGKGTFYRVRIVAGSKADAVALCEQYRSVGGSCIVSR